MATPTKKNPACAYGIEISKYDGSILTIYGKPMYPENPDYDFDFCPECGRDLREKESNQ